MPRGCAGPRALRVAARHCTSGSKRHELVATQARRRPPERGGNASPAASTSAVKDLVAVADAGPQPHATPRAAVHRRPKWPSVSLIFLKRSRSISSRRHRCGPCVRALNSSARSARTSSADGGWAGWVSGSLLARLADASPRPCATLSHVLHDAGVADALTVLAELGLALDVDDAVALDAQLTGARRMAMTEHLAHDQTHGCAR